MTIKTLNIFLENYNYFSITPNGNISFFSLLLDKKNKKLFKFLYSLL